MDAELSLKPEIRGDQNNLLYGSLEKSTVPKYRISGHGHIIGLDRGFKVLKTSNGRREIVAVGLDTAHRQRNQPSIQSISSEDRQVIKSQPSLDDDIRHQSNWISLGGSRKRRRLSEVQDVRLSIFAPPGDNKASDEESSTEDDTTGPGKEEPRKPVYTDEVQLRQRQLMKRTSDDPEDLQAWLDLIQHQSHVVRGSGEVGSRLNGSQIRTLIAMRIDLYEQALNQIKSFEAQCRLVTGLMREGSKVWEHEKQQSKWQCMLTDNASFEIQLLHLDFLMSSTQAFSYEKILNVGKGYLNDYRSKPPSTTRDKHIIRLLQRITCFMAQAGYNEHAWAVWQANLDANFCRPANVSDLSTSFEDFWDSECARLGESGALGWAKSLDASANVNEAPETPLPPSLPDSSWNEWSKAELRAQDQCLVPARTSDDTDDPFRIVLFADIRDYTVFDLGVRSQSVLIDAFLDFTRLPPVNPMTGSTPDPYLYDGTRFAFKVTSHHILPSSPPQAADTKALFASSTDLYAAFPTSISELPYARATAIILQQVAAAKPTDGDLAEYSIALELKLNPAGSRKLVKKMLKQRGNVLRLYNTYALMEASLNGLEAAARVWLAMLSGLDAQQTRERLQTLRLWAWECTTEHDSAKALEVLGSAPALKSKLAGTGRYDQLTSIQCKHAEDETRAFLWTQLSHAHSKNALDDLVNIVDLLALLQYHSTDRSLPSAVEVHERCFSFSTFKQSSTAMDSSTYLAFQQLHINRNRLIAIHTASPTVQFQPKKITALLQESCNTFPQNFAFRKHLHAFRSKSGGIDRLYASAMQTLHHSSVHESPLIDHLSNLHAALSLPVYQGGTEHAVRAAFQRALLPLSRRDADDEDSDLASTASILACPALNVAYLRWEIELHREVTHAQGEEGDDNKKLSKRDLKVRKKQTQNVKAAFQTAVANCPWVKEVYLVYLGARLELYSGEAGGAGEESTELAERQSECEEVYQSMLERGLRICIER